MYIYTRIYKRNGFSNPENKQKPGHKLPDDRKRRTEEKLEMKKIASLTAFLLGDRVHGFIAYDTRTKHYRIGSKGTKKKTSK